MADSGSFAVSRTETVDRVSNYLNIHRHQNQVLQQQLLRRNNHNHQLQDVAVAVAVADAENRTDSDDSHAALSTRSLLSASALSSLSKPPTNITNLDSFLDSVTPIVAAQKSSETNVMEAHPYYNLGDLWETFREASAYGAGVPLLLRGTHSTTQYYVPFLSGMQLYIDPQNPRMNNLKCPSEGNDVLEGSSAPHKLMKGKQVMNYSSGSSSSSGRGKLVFEYMEQEQPHFRRPLADKVSHLASRFPELIKYKSCDLSPSSWICVAWYPIYRIPVGPTLKDLDASFLTFHSLSTQPGGYAEAEGKGKGEGEEVDPCGARIRLPVIGLASYKLRGSIISPYGPQECEQENALLEAATNWLRNLQALLPDYQFFLNRYPHMR